MNKLSIIVKGVVIAMGISGLAHTHNDDVKKWTGLYAGIDLGAAFNQVQITSQQLSFTMPGERCDTRSDYSTFFPGLHLGYMYQFANHFVSGIEANTTFNANQYHTLDCNCPDNPNVSDRFLFKNQSQGSIKARGGRPLNWNNHQVFPYLATGVSFVNARLSYSNEGEDYYTKNNTQAGWLIGTGIEWSFAQNWTLRAEYSYNDYGNTVRMGLPNVYGLLDPDGKARADLNVNNILVAISYWIS